MELLSFKMLGPSDPAMQNHILEEKSPQPHYYEDLKFHLFIVPGLSNLQSYIWFIVCLIFIFILQVVVEQCSRS